MAIVTPVPINDGTLRFYKEVLLYLKCWTNNTAYRKHRTINLSNKCI